MLCIFAKENIMKTYSVFKRLYSVPLGISRIQVQTLETKESNCKEKELPQ